MALAFVQRVQGGSTASSATAAVTYGSTTASGSLLILLASANGATHNAPTDTAGNTWVQAGTTFDQGSNKLSIWYVVNAPANAGTVTMNFGASYIYRAVVIFEFSGAATSGVLDQAQGGQAGATATASTGSFTLAAASELLIAITVGTQTITGSLATTTNFAISGDAAKYYLDQYGIVSSNQAVTSTDSGTGSGIFGASFKAAAGGATRGLFRTPSLGGVGVGGSFFRDPLQAREQMVRKGELYVPERLAA